jgi:hypothetical protein
MGHPPPCTPGSGSTAISGRTTSEKRGRSYGAINPLCMPMETVCTGKPRFRGIFKLEWVIQPIASYADTAPPAEHSLPPRRRHDAPPNRAFADRFLRLSTVDTVASVLGRYGLVIVIGWIGALKFANFEAHQIQPLVANSPFMGWLYDFLSAYTFSALLGVVELNRRDPARHQARGSQTVDRRKPALHRLVRVDDQLSVHDPRGQRARGRRVSRVSLTGEFLLKDIPLLGLSFWTLADAMKAVGRRAAVPVA